MPKTCPNDARNMPPSTRSDPIRWEHREHNKVADYLCNLTMDVKRCTWRETRNADILLESNLVIFSDGGTRAECSASAWVLCAAIKEATIPILAGGIYFPQPISSFTAEAIALEKATEETIAWLGAT